MAGLLGEPSSEAQRQSFQEEVDVNLVNVDVVVVDKKGELVTDLGPDDFQVTDDGKKVEVDVLRAADGGIGGALGDGGRRRRPRRPRAPPPTRPRLARRPPSANGVV